jgi:hypothetical protein
MVAEEKRWTGDKDGRNGKYCKEGDTWQRGVTG